MQEQLTTLESQLQDKEQLISALTERLEQAAEQLDRLKRSGADRALRTGGGFPPELIEQQQELVDELQRAVQQWEDMQPGVLLGRIEMQIGEIRDLVSGQGTVMFSGSDRGGQGERNASPSRNGERERAPEKKEQKKEQKSPGSGSSAYEALKAGLLANDLSVSESQEDTHGSQDDREESQQSAVQVPTGPEYEETPLEDPPAAIDPESASADDLRKAVEERDKYIMYVLGRLRNAESRHHVPNNWKVLENMPEDLRGRLEVLEKQLQQTLRTAEVELSLHRAKLGREEARLRLLDEQVQKKLDRAGLTEEQAGEHETSAHQDNSPSSRWLRMIGRHKGKD